MVTESEFPFAEVTAVIRSGLQPSGPVVGMPMPGGASTRKFARFQFNGSESLVAIYVPDAHQSDEIDKSTGKSTRWPFLEVRDLLESRGIRVPKVLCEACDQGVLLVEDLGDVTLAVALERAPELREPLYQCAVHDLAQAQLALTELPPESVIRKRTFDIDLLRWEIDHFCEWALEARGIRLTPSELKIFEGAADWLAKTIASWPRQFVHRDYQSRNLMVRRDAAGRLSITWIDFQDALLGPRVYDLVALLGDSYQTFEPEFIERRLDDYAAVMRLDADGRSQLRREFDLVTVQRKLKDAGRFVFIDRVKKNPNFLCFVEPTIDKVMAALARLRDTPVLVELETLLRARLRP